MADRALRVEPAELAALLDLAERPRVDDWSLRAALTRYAQPEPAKVSALMNAVRRLEFALAEHQATFLSRGADIWSTLGAGADPADSPPDDPSDTPDDLTAVVALLRVAQQIDRLGDQLAAWAADGHGQRPDDDVDDVIAATERALAALGVPEQERPGPPPRGRRRSS